MVAVSLAVAEDLEPRHADGVHNRTAVGEKLHISHLKRSQAQYLCSERGKPGNTRTYLKHAAVVSEAFEVVGDAHAELLGARLHGAADHEAVARLEHVQRAGDGGEGHGAHKDGHFLV